MSRDVIFTEHAPAAIGPYSQAVKINGFVYISGQIPLDPNTMEVVSGGFEASAVRVFENLKAVAEASGGSLNDAVKVSIFLLDMEQFAIVNEVMKRYFTEPYPARAAIAVKQLPKNVPVEVEAVLHISD